MRVEIDDHDRYLMRQAFRVADECISSEGAFSVGSIVTTASREILSTGYSRELGPGWHAEEVAINRASDEIGCLENCVLYSTLEPCGERLSRPVTCCQLILRNSISIVFFAERESKVFVSRPNGAGSLLANGVRVLQLVGNESWFRRQNSHLY